MFDRKRSKASARRSIKNNYAIFVIACLIAAYIGSAYSSTLSSIQSSTVDYIVDSAVEGKSLDTVSITSDQVLASLLEGKYQESIIASDELMENELQATQKYGSLEFGRARGILSSLVNNVNSGKVLVIIFQAILSITKSQSTATTIFVILAAAVMLFLNIFIKNTYKVAFRRIFLEGHEYEKVKLSRFLFIFRVKRFFKVALTILVADIYQLLWDLTIVGGIIKRYSYYMVPYIVAENPDIKPRDAIELSKRMMYGHKWECFKLEMSFIGWWLLGSITLGISKILFSNPYEEATYCSYYAYLRKLAKQKGISYCDKLNDTYLFKKADIKLIQKTYSDVVEIMNDDIDVRDLRHTGFRGFIENNLGIIYKYDKEEDLYNVAIEQEEKIAEYKNILMLRQYPGRLFPMPLEKRDPRLEHVHYLRHYSIWSVIALFFIFCFIGWSWEVMLHLVKDGVFVNRGVNHGPWLPIYGTGGVMILIFLFRFRNRPGLEALSAISLCGFVEYMTHWWLEVTKGTKWWDYSGYFLNLNGRICAEGLIVFMLGGLAIVYALAPVVDNWLRKINQKTLKIICIILLVIFSIDVIYSNKHPNMGEGITDYDEVAVIDSERIKL